ncbi:hypothetical protein BBH99_19430 [Chryseobacterium contaminans]|uniref:DUF4280 domain-containing protein n=1 Tax=Chryseobacterium contaminans TaxID=1423959 RepID=A0A1M7G371_9FLAO|nr:DUF4280 domain-containing protein [Chryseobacterium contaminans]OCA79307.1 hypothetical protein BBH99_19430 [Chryseobacterium contaminans]SHM10518.1 protein of unknown function [Chryseobacterium contaminans]
MSENLSAHEGQHFVIQKGKASCNQGDLFPQFKVSSHQKHYWNHKEAIADYLAVTEEDVQFNPSGPSFGKCRLKPSSGGYLPCAYAPAGKWMKTYEKVKVMGKSCLSEISELMCSTGGIITVKEHGQTSIMNRQNITLADLQSYHLINPFMDLKESQEELEEPDPIYE